MPAPQALGVLDETLGLLDGSPAAPAGASRVAIRSVAVQRNGDLALIPARFRTGALRTDAAELGELLHLALTGSMWEETGLPLSETAPEVPAPVAALVTDLLDGTALTGGAVDRDGVAAMRARIARLGPTRDRGFLPAEPGVAVEDAPTGTLSPDVVVALRGAPQTDPTVPAAPSYRSPASREQRHEGHVAGLRRTHRRNPRRETGVTGTRRARQRVVRSARRSRLTLGVLVFCTIGVAAGAGIMGTGAGEGAGDADAQHAPTPTVSLRAPDPTPTPPVGVEDGVADGSAAVSADPSPGPLEAAVELTRARAEAFALGDAEALAAVTVPGSPAAEADAERTLGECSDCADALSLTDVGFADDPDRHSEAGDGPPDEAAADGGPRVRVQALMRTAGAEPIPVVLVLERHDGRWRVHDVHPS